MDPLLALRALAADVDDRELDAVDDERVLHDARRARAREQHVVDARHVAGRADRRDPVAERRDAVTHLELCTRGPRGLDRRAGPQRGDRGADGLRHDGLAGQGFDEQRRALRRLWRSGG